jgi:hypothetical protein
MEPVRGGGDGVEGQSDEQAGYQNVLQAHTPPAGPQPCRQVEDVEQPGRSRGDGVGVEEPGAGRRGKPAAERVSNGRA